MTKTPISQVLARVSLCWPMSVCGKNVDTLRACKRSNRDFFPYIYRKYLYILSFPVFLYYAESPKVPPRVFGPLGPKTLRGQKLPVDVLMYSSFQMFSVYCATFARHSLLDIVVQLSLFLLKLFNFSISRIRG